MGSAVSLCLFYTASPADRNKRQEGVLSCFIFWSLLKAHCVYFCVCVTLGNRKSLINCPLWQQGLTCINLCSVRTFTYSAGKKNFSLASVLERRRQFGKEKTNLTPVIESCCSIHPLSNSTKFLQRKNGVGKPSLHLLNAALMLPGV